MDFLKNNVFLSSTGVSETFSGLSAMVSKAFHNSEYRGERRELSGPVEDSAHSSSLILCKHGLLTSVSANDYRTSTRHPDITRPALPLSSMMDAYYLLTIL